MLLCLLSMFALPMETAAHAPHRFDADKSTTRNPQNSATNDFDNDYIFGPDPNPDISNIIEWVRVYKNPKTTPTRELGSPTQTSGRFRRWAMPGVAIGSSWILPSMHWEETESDWSALNEGEVWVDFNTATGDGSLIDTGENSGLVTATENTTVTVNDRVAIAVKFTTFGGYIRSDMTIGPRAEIRYEQVGTQGGRTDVLQGTTHIEGPWRLNPNLQVPQGYQGSGQEHVLVYQFVVGEEHAILNAEGPWLEQDFVTVGIPSLGDDFALNNLDNPNYNYVITRNDGSRIDSGDLQVEAVDWIYSAMPPREVLDPGNSNLVHRKQSFDAAGQRLDFGVRTNADSAVLPSSTAVKPWNTTLAVGPTKENWDVGAPPYPRANLPAGYPGGASDLPGVQGWHNHRRGNLQDQTPTHRHVPMYDPKDKEIIYYPKVVVGDTDNGTTVSSSTAITDVPTGTQTGEFQVTLGFSEVQEIADFTIDRRTFAGVRSAIVETGVPLIPPPDRSIIPVPGASVSIFVAHDVSDAGVTTSQTSLTAALAAADPPWTVTEMAYAGGIEIAASGKMGPRNHGNATRYTLTLSPPLGVKGDIALQIPADAVLDVAGNGNAASEAVMVSVDTSLRLAAGAAVEIVEPESGTYLGGDALEVRVPFAADGLTYEGNNPPYITIYLGERTSANARHAIWQRGEETSGSTIVPFVYVVSAEDPVVSSVLVGSEGLSVPEGTTLMSSSGLSRVGTAAPPKESGEEADDAGSEQVVLATDTGAPLPETEAPVNVLPAVLLLPEESDPKSAASSVPRTPIVFNELGNGSGAANDWLELRNVTDAAVSLKDWELSIVADAKQEDTSLVVFPDVSVPANGLLLLTNMPSDKTPLAGGDDVAAAGSDKRRKGLQHLSLVDAALSLPDDGKFLLILRNAKEKRGLNEAFVDVAGGGGSSTDAFIREQTGLYDTHVWPLQVLESPGSDTEDSLSAGKVWLRAKADIVGYHKDAWAEAAFSGLGYDRKVSKSAETAGTPGYPNGAVKTEPATPKGAVTMSEVMFDSAGGTLPQWIELYNTSKTEALNLNRWELEIQNRKSEDLVGRPVVTLTLQEKLIQPNQTLLIVTGNARASSADVFPADRVYNLIELHEKNLRIKTPRDTFLSAEGFYLKLTDTNGHLVDEIGNTDGDRRTDDTPAWALPVPLSEVEGMRSSLVRRYDNGVAREGTSRQGWALAANFAKFKADGLHYGHADDIGTPGYRQGGALPVELSSFTLTRTESGAVVVTWTTESEVDNAGFNLRRSLQRDSGYTLLNPALIAGAGTTGERQTYTFIDTSAKPGVEHYYQIEEVSFGGKRETLLMRRLRGPVSPAHRALTTFGEVKQAK
ncbi:hypothetical protein C6495_02725 [Candidatus Poribacteria bacterium]|nr:MAG: hypothetical protein C6495_02725 [Candidatus Poribacteria bacterium]